MSALPGTWTMTMRTPIGRIDAEMTFLDEGGAIVGSAVSNGETVALHDVTVIADEVGERVTWTQAVTKPMRLHLTFEVVVVGDRMEGRSRAGRLPRSAVTGRRS